MLLCLFIDALADYVIRTPLGVVELLAYIEANNAKAGDHHPAYQPSRGYDAGEAGYLDVTVNEAENTQDHHGESHERKDYAHPHDEAQWFVGV